MSLFCVLFRDTFSVFNPSLNVVSLHWWSKDRRHGYGERVEMCFTVCRIHSKLFFRSLLFSMCIILISNLQTQSYRQGKCSTQRGGGFNSLLEKQADEASLTTECTRLKVKRYKVVHALFYCGQVRDVNMHVALAPPRGCSQTPHFMHSEDFAVAVCIVHRKWLINSYFLQFKLFNGYIVPRAFARLIIAILFQQVSFNICVAKVKGL